MARPTTRRTKQRVDVDMTQASVPVQINRRFFSASGNDEGVRAARALENAFKSISGDADAIMRHNNDEGAAQAVAERAAGNVDRDADNEQAGYMRMWDELDASDDFRSYKDSLPQLLEDNNWDQLEEADLQALLSEHQKQLFAGIEDLGDSAYAQYLAPRLLQVETETITQHRENRLAEHRAEMNSKDLRDAKAQLARDGELDYTTMFIRNGAINSGPAKKEQWVQKIAQIALEAEDSSIIDNMPSHINGIPTGKDDPALQSEWNRARNAADSAAATRLAAEEKAKKKANEAALFQSQLDLVRIGLDPSVSAGEREARLQDLRDAIARNPEANIASLSSVDGYLKSRVDNLIDFSNNPVAEARLGSLIYRGEANIDDIVNAFNDGIYGGGDKATDTLLKHLSILERQTKAAEGSSGKAYTELRLRLSEEYNPQLDSFGAFDPLIREVRSDALNEYTTLVLDEGMSPREAYSKVTERYNEIMEKNNKSTRNTRVYENRSISPAEFKSVVTDPDSAGEVLRGAPSKGVSLLIEAYVDEGLLTPEDGADLATILNL